MNRLAAPALFMIVTPLLAIYGTSWWSFLGGPAAAIPIHLLQIRIGEPAEGPGRLRGQFPARTFGRPSSS